LDLLTEIEKIATGEIILLLDFDRRGKEWTAVLRQNLEKSRIKVNVAFRKELSRSTRGQLKDIEGLAAYMQTLNKKLGEG